MTSIIVELMDMSVLSLKRRILTCALRIHLDKDVINAYGTLVCLTGFWILDFGFCGSFLKIEIDIPEFC